MKSVVVGLAVMGMFSSFADADSISKTVKFRLAAHENYFDVGNPFGDDFGRYRAKLYHSGGSSGCLLNVLPSPAPETYDRYTNGIGWYDTCYETAKSGDALLVVTREHGDITTQEFSGWVNIPEIGDEHEIVIPSGNVHVYKMSGTDFDHANVYLKSAQRVREEGELSHVSYEGDDFVGTQVGSTYWPKYGNKGAYMSVLAGCYTLLVATETTDSWEPITRMPEYPSTDLGTSFVCVPGDGKTTTFIGIDGDTGNVGKISTEVPPELARYYE
ncbi:hypothetical protein [Neptunomonas sp. XY-337]|uniref:hypothetical protein n=1 Tax=Neptunomonas sp. XY-337 TaxID=2561897 RepID=UPI0010AB4482|nr:hypothetical protein [Neptunomonas sp. XY-337]